METTLKIGGKNITVKENVIDRAIRYFNPVKGQERFKARAITALAGGYNGASKSRRGMAGWSTLNRDADSDILPDLPTLRDNSRDLVRNSPLATGAINTVCTNTVGTGLKLQSRIDRDILSMDEEAADEWEANTERLFRLWAESKECDAARTLNFMGQQSLVFRSTLESGDTFTLLPMITRPGSPFDLKLQIIEADRICNENNLRDSDSLYGGVKKDEHGAPVEYHIMEQHPGNKYSTKGHTWRKVKAFGAKSGRRNVIHLYDLLRPGQTRGVPYLAPVIEPLKQLDRYSDAELMAAVVSGMFTVFIKTEDGNGAEDLLPETATGGKDSDDDLKLDYGSIVGLTNDESIETANPGRPNTAFDPFVQAILRQVGVALEIPFEILVGHFTSSYSASRAALLAAFKFFLKRRQWLADNFCQPVYETWMDEAVAKGMIYAPGYFDSPVIRKAYCGSEWIGPSKGMIDEKKEVEAAILRNKAGYTTISEETAQLTGGDYDKKHPQLVKENNLRKRDGLIAIEVESQTEEMPPKKNKDEEDEEE